MTITITIIFIIYYLLLLLFIIIYYYYHYFYYCCLNRDLISVNQWLCANKLSLNIDKSNFVIFRPPQNKVNYNIKLKIDNKLKTSERWKV